MDVSAMRYVKGTRNNQGRFGSGFLPTHRGHIEKDEQIKRQSKAIIDRKQHNNMILSYHPAGKGNGDTHKRYS